MMELVVTDIQPGEADDLYGGWKQVRVDGEMGIRVWCPLCGAGYLLDHEVGESGHVTPSLDCPNKSCTFHEMARLVGWEERPFTDEGHSRAFADAITVAQETPSQSQRWQPRQDPWDQDSYR